MTKEDAVAFLISIDFDNGNKEVRAALEAEVEKRTETPKATAKPAVKAKATAKAKPTMEGIKAKVAAKKAAPKSTVSKAEVVAQLADMEDAPY
jgi:hypothetical protein